MTIHFYLRFHTDFGQRLLVSGDIEALGNSDEKKAFTLNYFDNEFWEGSITVDPEKTARIKYKYILANADGFTIHEGGKPRTIDLGKTGIEEIRVIDAWNHAGEFENVFYTDPYQEILLPPHDKKFKHKSPKNFSHIFRVKAPLLQKNEVVCVSGSGSALKEWDKKNPVLLAPDNEWWSCKISIPKEDFPLSYKYGVYNIKENEFVRFEEGQNRLIHDDASAKKITIIHDGFVHLPNNAWKGAGVSVPVFSLRGKNSFGIGEFADLKLLVDWAKKTGLRLIQILPVNDTTATGTWTDSYPYASISAFALHPIYINLDLVAGKKYSDLIKPLKKKQKQLNEQPVLDYEQVLKFKTSTLKELFSVQKEDFLTDKDFLDFFESNKHWLVPYAAFCYLRDRNGTSDFTTWKIYSKYDKAAIEKYTAPRAKHYDSIALQYFIQYHLHLQLKEAAEYAHKNGVILKGDIPIGIYRYGCDAWVSPDLYHMDQQAGAPPDLFAVAGQNWGFPTYNWAKMAEDGFEWWHKRFVQMSNYFDAFRIDHILGFFRIWSIPIESVEGTMGRFVPALPVHVNEFSQRGMWFNYHRLCNPYINEAVLWEMFGPNNQKFKEYLDDDGNGFFALKENFNTQRKVEKHFAALDENEENGHLKQGLFDLISNFILLENPGSNGQEFHFKFSMDQTISFKHLDWHMQQQLQDLYINYFYRRQDDFWMREAMKKLPALKNSTNMLICGEDLGMVPHCVPDVMKQLGILSLEIQRMPKDPNKEFFNPADAPYLSVVTPSTHDMSTIRGWWEEDRQRTQDFFTKELGQWGDAPETCEAWINKGIVIQHLHSPAIWSIFQIQDILGMDEKIRRADPEDERINIPSNPRHYWKYRMHISLEDLLKQKEFNEMLANFVEAGGR